MLPSFEFKTATEIVFGRGKALELHARVLAFGRRALIVTGSEPRRHAPVLANFGADDFELSFLSVPGEPSVELVRRGVELAREARVQVVVGIGGGSALDAGKAIAALVDNPGDPLEYLEVIGQGRQLERPSLPYVAVPTTSGTGAEVTKNAVLAAEEQAVKVSLRSDGMLPRLALVDPELTLGVPRDVTAQTGLDALTQVIEPYLSCKANPLTDSLCVAAIEQARHGLRRAVEDGSDIDARERMSLVSLFGGLALANAKLGAVHGIAGPFGGMFDAPHGAICARLLPHVFEANLKALRQRAPESPTLLRFRHVAQLLTGNPDARAEEGIQWLTELVSDFDIPRLGSYGFCTEHETELLLKSARASSMQGNPIVLTPNELRHVLESAR